MTVRQAMNRLGLGLTPEQIVKSIEVLDTDGDGEISLVRADTHAPVAAKRRSPAAGCIAWNAALHASLPAAGCVA